MAQYQFGSGILWGIPLTDARGNTIETPTPVQFGELQNCSVDFSFETKTLHGQNQFPVAVGRGKGKITGKAAFARINGLLFNSLFFGQTLQNGIVSDIFSTDGVQIPASPSEITVQPPNSGSFAFDLGVRDEYGNTMVRVNAAPNTGQYAVDGSGKYTFASAQASKFVYINYQYTADSTTAKKMTIKNLPMGYSPTFKAELFMPYQGKTLTCTLLNCVSAKMSLSTKQDDFVMPDLDFECFANPNGDLVTLATSE